MNQRPAFSSPEHPNIVDAVTFFTTALQFVQRKTNNKTVLDFSFLGLQPQFVKYVCTFAVQFFGAIFPQVHCRSISLIFRKQTNKATRFTRWFPGLFSREFGGFRFIGANGQQLRLRSMKIRLVMEVGHQRSWDTCNLLWWC